LTRPVASMIALVISDVLRYSSFDDAIILATNLSSVKE
jgi:hypothetical protein